MKSESRYNRGYEWACAPKPVLVSDKQYFIKKNPPTLNVSAGECGPGRNRTFDLQIMSLLL